MDVGHVEERGCGFRTLGGIYACTDLVRNGEPIESFLIDPPLAIDTAALGMTRVGVRMIERDGVWHILDWIGDSHYPNVADFVEEVKRQGLSRRLGKNLSADGRNGFELLSARSTIILLHARAMIGNHADYRQAVIDGGGQPCAGIYCPHGRPEHTSCDPSPTQCAGTYWQDIAGGGPVGNMTPIAWENRQRAIDGVPPLRETPLSLRTVRRSMPAFDYVGWSRPPGVEPVYAVGAFMRLPIGRLTVIDDPIGGTHEDALRRLEGATIPVKVESS